MLAIMGVGKKQSVTLMRHNGFQCSEKYMCF